MLLTFYRGLTKTATPLLEGYLRRRLSRGKEDPVRFNERRGKPTKPREKKTLVWLHAASVGEAQALLAVINKLLADYPFIQIMVTTGTVTSAKLMSERLPAGAFHQYIPVDQPDWTESFLNHWHPDFVIWSESEFWPNMLAGIRQRKIPAILLNARMSDKSFRHWQKASGLIKDMLGTFRLCLGQSQTEIDRLLKLGAAEARVSSNLKYAAAPLPCDPEKLEAAKKQMGERPLILWASTHPGEEEMACRLHHNLIKLEPALLTIIVPRHPQRGPAIADIAEWAELRSARRSLNHRARKDDHIYIADTLGELGLFYRLCRLCVIGGSFVPIGGHNPIEPAQFSCQIFYGPHMFNFVSICTEFESHHAALRVNDEAALEKNLALALQDPAQFAALGAAAKDWTQQREHTVDEISALLAPFLRAAAP
jgi:3-deoxy-D-manno-octulosonic-acid transferase